MFSDEQKKMLALPLNRERVKTRDAGRGRSVAYIEAYDAIDSANRIFGFDGWSLIVPDVNQVGRFEVQRKNGPATVTLYQASATITAGGVSRTDYGCGTAESDTPEEHDKAIKAAVSDAMKRALRSFGAQFGNSLYDKDGPELANPRCDKHDVEMQQGRTGKWGHVLEDGKTPCFGEAA